MSTRRQISAEAFRKQVEAARFQAVMFATRFPFLETTLSEEILQHDENQFEDEKSQLEEKPNVIPVNLFG